MNPTECPCADRVAKGDQVNKRDQTTRRRPPASLDVLANEQAEFEVDLSQI